MGHLRTEWNVRREKWFHGESLDPVFEGVVKDFCVFDVTMQDIYKKVEVFMKGVDSLAEGLVTLSEATIAGLTHVDDDLIKSDSCKVREATNQITRADAPHSAIAKLRRDMDFNIVNPIRSHLLNNRNLKAQLEKRRRRMIELNVAKKQHEDCVKRGLQQTDRRFLQAQSALESSKMSFHEVDRNIFEWLYILEEYKGDILDSTLQTLKYLQYEFFATSAHAISGVLPARMEFRPMVEMTPEHLEAQVEMELADEEEGVVTDFSVRLIEKLAKDNKSKPGEGVDSCANDPGPALPVDPLSLSSLLSQGFEEGPARRALRMHRNDTQAALDWLINGGGDDDVAGQEDKVRMPTTVRRVQRLKAKRRAQQEKLRMQEEEDDDDKDDEEEDDEEEEEEEDEEDEEDTRSVPAQRSSGSRTSGSNPPPPRPPPPPSDLLGLDASAAAPAPPARTGGGDTDLLSLGEEPPPPTDFRKQVDTAPLPPQRALDLSRCEKQPLPASIAAGTAAMRSNTPVASNGADGGSSGADFGTMGWRPPPPPPPADAASGADAAVRSILAAQAKSQGAANTTQITPEQLILAAQQLASGQAPSSQGQGGQSAAAVTGAFGQPVVAAGGGYPVACSGVAQGGGTAAGQTGQQPPPSPPPQPKADGFQSLDPLAGFGGGGLR